MLREINGFIAPTFGDSVKNIAIMTIQTTAQPMSDYIPGMKPYYLI